MKRKFLYIFCIVTILVLSACGSEATPTVNAVDVQNTAIANAWLAITQTQAAIPTATATPTLAPTVTAAATLMLFPTLPPLQPTVPAGNPTMDPCNDVPPAKPKGTTVQVKFVNKSEGTVGPFSFGMLQPNSLGECGTYVFYMGKFDAPVVTVLAGCYWGYAVITSPSSIARNPQPLCVTDTTKAVAIWVTKELVNFH